MNIIASTLFWLFLAATCISFFPVALFIYSTTFLFDRRLRFLHWFTCFWSSLYTWVNPFWHVAVVRKTEVDPGQAYIMVSNHESMVDIFALFRTFLHFKWVSKAENFRFPFVGWNMRLNRYIELKRGSMRSNADMMRDCEKALRLGSSVFIFPEGTRSRNGVMGSFKRGAFELAKRTGLPILPMAIDGSSRALPKGGIMLKGSHHIRIHVIQPITHEEITRLNADELSDLTKQRIADELAVMRA